jgi:hypothetical protein
MDLKTQLTIAKKILDNQASPEEKLAFLKALNDSIERMNKNLKTLAAILNEQKKKNK